MKSPRQQRNEARRARHRAAAETAAFNASQDVARRTRDASDAARLARFEVQGRGYRPIFAQSPVVIGTPIPVTAEAQIGGGDVDDVTSRVSPFAQEKIRKARGLGGGVE